MCLGVSGIALSLEWCPIQCVTSWRKITRQRCQRCVSPSHLLPGTYLSPLLERMFFFLISNLKEMKISCGLSWPAFCGSHRIPEAEVINKKFYSCGSEGFRCNQQAWPLGGDYAGCFTTWKRNCHVQKESTTWVSWLYNNSSRKNSPFYKTPWNQHRYNPKIWALLTTH